MPYGTLAADAVQSSTAGTPPQFNDGNGTQIGTLCRAWVNFNGTTSPGTIRASFNVSSVTRNGTGDYTVNFTTALPDANYALAGCTNLQGSSGRSIVVFDRSDSTAKTTTACRIGTGYLDATNSGGGDGAYSSVAFFR